MSHIIILKKLQKIKMRTRTTNQSEKKNPKPSSQQIHQTHAGNESKPKPAVGLARPMPTVGLDQRRQWKEVARSQESINLPRNRSLTVRNNNLDLGLIRKLPSLLMYLSHEISCIYPTKYKKPKLNIPY
jgi:hypothetical protein